jgi:hypothetical protein
MLRRILVGDPRGLLVAVDQEGLTVVLPRPTGDFLGAEERKLALALAEHG